MKYEVRSMTDCECVKHCRGRERGGLQCIHFVEELT